jgi:hypothetical protein
MALARIGAQAIGMRIETEAAEHPLTEGVQPVIPE